MADSLVLSHLRLQLVPEEPLQLPACNKGNAIRGGFGNAFRKLVCVDMRWECAQCSLRFSCPYTKVFNPFIPPDASQFSGNQNIPRPFVFKPPLSTQGRYQRGEPLVFDLILVGQAVQYLPYFIVAFRELGASGFGLNRARVQLARVDAVGRDGTASEVYDGTANVVRPADSITLEVLSAPHLLAGGDSAVGDNGKQLTLEFLTPTTLKTGSTVGRAAETVHRPAFHHVFKRLRDRINALATFYGSGPLPADFKNLGRAAEQVETVADQTRWLERSRVSRRRGVEHDLSGFVGAITFRGDIDPFLPWLRAGEYVHVGKNAVFGNGWFVIRDAIAGTS